jgi:hypothetical protein
MKKMIGIFTIITLMVCVPSIILSIMEKDWTEVMAWVCVGLNVGYTNVQVEYK